MKINITKKVGDTTLQFQVEEPKDVDALFSAGCIGSMPSLCGHCGSEDVELRGKKAKGYTFVTVHCNECRYESGMGQYKEGGFFWKQFEPQVVANTDSIGGQVKAATKEDLDSIPF